MLLSSPQGNCSYADFQDCMLQNVLLAAKHNLKIVPGVPVTGGMDFRHEIDFGKSTNVPSLRKVDSRIWSNSALWGFNFYGKNSNIG